LGGAPITQQFANEIGADGYSQDAASAVDTALKLLN
jgi:5-methyltetrahydrofolate--homocysteine methyltransferase